MQMQRISDTEAVSSPVVIGLENANCQHKFAEFDKADEHKVPAGITMFVDRCTVCNRAMRTRLQAVSKEALDMALAAE